MARYNPRQERSLKRHSNYRDIKQSFLIICEGVNTEPDYFNAFRLTSASVKALGKGLNTIKLVQEAVIVRNEERRKGHNFDQYWVVFDKDDFSNHDFNEAIRLAESNGFQVRIAIKRLSIGSCCISICIVATSIEMITSKCLASR